MPQKKTQPPASAPVTPKKTKFYCPDNLGTPHFGETVEEAQSKAAAANREIDIKNDRDGL